MQSEIKTLETYFSIFRTFQLKAKKGLGLLEEAAKVRSIEIIIDQANYSALFQYLGFRIRLCFMKNVNKRLGYLRWYYLYRDEIAQKERGRLIFEHCFDESGNIAEEKDKEESIYCFQEADFTKYFYKTLLRFCQTVDQETCSGF